MPGTLWRSRRALLAALAAGTATLVGRSVTTLSVAEATHGGVHLGGSNSAATPTVITNTSSSANARAVIGEISSTSPGTDSAGLLGRILGTHNEGYGVHGSHAGAGRGVFGLHRRSTGGAPGVRGETASTTDGAAGVVGEVTSPEAGYESAGVIGLNRGTFSVSHGVLGVSESEEGNGVSGISPYHGVFGQGTGAGATGVYGSAGFEPGRGVGVLGETFSEEGAGVEGYAGAGAGTGVSALAGVRGVNSATNANTHGVWGSHAGSGSGVYGTSVKGSGLRGYSDEGHGVYAQAYGQHAVLAWGHGGTLDRAALRAVSSQVGNGWAGNFEGKVYASRGFVSGAAAAVQMDHPLDPANQYLTHAGVSAPEHLNVYSGNAVTDDAGRATIELPAYVEALNTDFRYQLTVLGDFAQAVVAKKLAGGRFTIRTDRPGVEVSWQVTGVRKEAYSGSRVAVESLKPEELRGRYVDAAAYGQPEEKRIGWSAREVNSA